MDIETRENVLNMLQARLSELGSRDVPRRIKVDVRIMAVPSRSDMVDGLLKKLDLSDDKVTWDYFGIDNGGSPMRTSRNAFLSPFEDYTHRLVLQDDVDVVDDFLKYVHKCAENFPHDLFSFYSTRIPESDKGNTPYVKICGSALWTQGLMIPIDEIVPCFYWALNNLGPDNRDDDAAINGWVYHEKKTVMTTIPNLVQHCCPMKSVVGFNHPSKFTRLWQGYDVSKEDWDTREYSETSKVMLSGYSDKPNSKRYWEVQKKNWRDPKYQKPKNKWGNRTP